MTLPEFIRSDPQKFLNFLGRRTDHLTKIRVNNRVVTDSTIIAQGFNSYFQSVFLMERATIARNPVEDPGDVPTISVNGVVSMLRKLER